MYIYSIKVRSKLRDFVYYSRKDVMKMSREVNLIKEDILNTLKVCEEITIDKWKKRPFRQKMIQYILRIFSPML